MNSKSVKKVAILGIIAIAVFVVIYGGITLFNHFGNNKKIVTTKDAMQRLSVLSKDITVNDITPSKDSVDLNTTDVKDVLPDISKYPLTVDSSTKDYIEIFSSTEKAGKGSDGWINDVAKEFNSAGIKVNGKTVSVKIRSIASGTGMDYIVSGKYVPDAFTPSNELWGEMMKSKGVTLTETSKRLVGNVAGILTSKKENARLIKKYGSVNLKNITEAVENNGLEMGYTDPFTSSTGLNFLASALSTFDSKNPLSDSATAKFEKFQTNIPFVASTTLQMRDSATSGVLDGFILEYQSYFNLPDLKSNYIFTPFGYRHDSPMYQIGKLSSEKAEILKKFDDYCETVKSQNIATSYGFNKLNNYNPKAEVVSGDTISQEQKLWKEKKSGANQIAAVFVADTSGSMDGAPLTRLKKSLLNGSKYIGSDNSIGLVSFSDTVNINLPIAKFNLNQRAYFTGAVNSLSASGSTAMFDGITTATKMLMAEKAKNPNTKLMMFVLTDGDTNCGHTLDDIKPMMKALKIPIYTIGYNADVKALQEVSSINEAASINADTDDVVYKLENLFNVQM